MENITWNIAAFKFLNSLIFNDPWIDNLVTFFAESLDMILIIFAVLFILFHKYWHEKENLSKKEIVKVWVRESFVLLAGATLAWLIAFFLKDIFSIPRPFIALPDANLLFEHGGEDSFPSGHASFFSALSLAIFFYHRRAGRVFFLCTLLMSLSRVIAGIHYPLDILVGWVIGLGSASAFRLSVYHRVKKMIGSNL